MSSAPPEAFNVYYNGWSRRGEPRDLDDGDPPPARATRRRSPRRRPADQRVATGERTTGGSGSTSRARPSPDRPDRRCSIRTAGSSASFTAEPPRAPSITYDEYGKIDGLLDRRRHGGPRACPTGSIRRHRRPDRERRRLVDLRVPAGGRGDAQPRRLRVQRHPGDHGAGRQPPGSDVAHRHGRVRHGDHGPEIVTLTPIEPGRGPIHRVVPDVAGDPPVARRRRALGPRGRHDHGHLRRRGRRGGRHQRPADRHRRRRLRGSR